MEHLSDFLEERFAKITASTHLLLLSHAEDSHRDEGDTHSGLILSWMENNLDIVCVPLYGKLPHDTQGQLGVHVAADMREVAAALSPFLGTISRFLTQGRCVFLGKEPAKVLRYALDATTLEHAMELPHPQLWNRKHAGTETLEVEIAIQTLRPLHESPKWAVLPSVVSGTSQTSKRLAAQQETGRRVGKLIRPPASEKKRENCRWVGRIWGGAKKATARSRAASSVVGSITGRLKLNVEQRVKCAEVALRTMSTEEGQVRQRQRALDMNDKKDKEKSKEAVKKGLEEHWDIESPYAHINQQELRAQVEAGVSRAELCHQYMIDEKNMRGWMTKKLKIPARTVAKNKLLSHNLDPEAQSLAKELHRLGFNPRSIAVLLPKPVNVLDIGNLLGLQNPEKVFAKEPMKNVSKNSKNSKNSKTPAGEWFSAERLVFLVENVAVDRLAHCFRNCGRYILLWKDFFERIKAGEVLENPCRMPAKTAKNLNHRLRNNVDIDNVVAEHNATVRATMRAKTAEDASRKRGIREGEHVDAEQKLQERKRARAAASSKSSSSDGTH